MHQRTNSPYPDIILFEDLTFNRWLSFYRIDYILLYTIFLVILIIIIILITEARIISQTDGSRVISSTLNHIVPPPHTHNTHSSGATRIPTVSNLMDSSSARGKEAVLQVLH